MKALATALINLTAFVELSEDDIVDPDSAASALEHLANDLRDASLTEVECLKTAIREQISKPLSDGDSRVAFLSGFLENLGIVSE